MSALLPVVITDMQGNSIRMHPMQGYVYIAAGSPRDRAGVVALTVDQCAALIAAITDAARVVTGEGK